MFVSTLLKQNAIVELVRVVAAVAFADTGNAIENGPALISRSLQGKNVSPFISRWIVFCLLSLCVSQVQSAEWSVPVAGNAFRSVPVPGNSSFLRDGTLSWSDTKDVFSVYFHVDRPATLNLAINARVPAGSSEVVARTGKQVVTTTLKGAEFASHKIGSIEVPFAGYVRVDLQGAKRVGKVYAEIRDLVVSSESDDLVLDYVKTNDGNMFYWGRRGPSVHLRYEVPKDTKLQYAYSELTVPKGQDTIGSYFMTNGFGEGYFGIQVNSPKERRVLFSVWSPFQTDNPRDIPEDQRVLRLGAGDGVRVGEFGNEGAGGQSFLVYPWKADVTYCFLTEVKPDGPSSTIYTAWFCEKSTNEWRLVASFRRPRTQTHLRGFHSFLENFDPAYGNITRSAFYGNVWVRDIEDRWHECAKASFSVDATGRGHHRLDFIGGADGNRFFLRNCGFFSETGQPGEVYSRQSTADLKPEIQFDLLPRP